LSGAARIRRRANQREFTTNRLAPRIGLAIAFFALVALPFASPFIFAQRGTGQFAQPSGPRDVVVTPIEGVIGAGATWKIAWQGPDNADGLVGTPDGGVLFAQEQPSRVRKLDANDNVSVYVEGTDGAGALALDSAGRLVAVQRTCTDPGLNKPCSEPTKIAIVHPENERKVLADRFEGKPLGRLNDLVVSRQGVVYFTVGGAYAVGPGGRVVAIGESVATNGIMLSPDERVLYVTNGRTIAAFDIQSDGSARNQREFARLEAGGSGDGMAIDAAGRLYVTSQPGIQVFSSGGTYLGVIPTPRNVISVAFSGIDRKTLYVVGSGALGADGKELTTPAGVRNNAKTIYKIPMMAEGFKGRAK
jgi:gluconolactonase